MRVDRRFAIVVGLSLVWASLVSAVFYRVAASKGRQSPVEPEKPLVVAVQPIPVGTLIKPEFIKLIRVPGNLVPKGGFSRPEDVLDRPVISPIQPEEPVVEARLAPRGSGVGVAPLIPPGMRAISVRVNDVVGVAGFILPGMRVDVLVTGHSGGREDTMTATVLQNITVLSAGQTIQADAGKQSINTPVVTLLVSPGQAESLTLANNEGRIQLVLRNSSDQQMAQTTGRQLSDLYGLERRAPPPSLGPVRGKPAAAPATPPPAGVTVVLAPPDGVLMIRGNLKTVEALEPHQGGSK